MEETVLSRKQRREKERRDLTLDIINHRHGGNAVLDTCKKYNITVPTYYKYLNMHGYKDREKQHLHTVFVGKNTPNIKYVKPIVEVQKVIKPIRPRKIQKSTDKIGSFNINDNISTEAEGVILCDHLLNSVIDNQVRRLNMP